MGTDRNGKVNIVCANPAHESQEMPENKGFLDQSIIGVNTARNGLMQEGRIIRGFPLLEHALITASGITFGGGRQPFILSF
jgi:hypothetical protein